MYKIKRQKKELLLFRKAFKVVDSLNNQSQYECALNYINNYYRVTKDIHLYGILLKKLKNKEHNSNFNRMEVL
jgi:hypothetical protein